MELSDVAVKEVLNKKTPEELLKKVLDGEITSGKEIKKERENISRALEIFSQKEVIEEAEIIEENYKNRIGIQKNVIVDKVKAITKTDKETFEKLLKIQEILKSME